MASGSVVASRFDALGISGLTPEKGLTLLRESLRAKSITAADVVSANHGSFWQKMLTESPVVPMFFEMFSLLVPRKIILQQSHQ